MLTPDDGCYHSIGMDSRSNDW